MSRDDSSSASDPLFERLFAEAEACLDKRGRPQESQGTPKQEASVEGANRPQSGHVPSASDGAQQRGAATSENPSAEEALQKLRERLAAQKKRHERDLDLALTKQKDALLRSYLELMDDLERALAVTLPKSDQEPTFEAYRGGIQKVFEGGLATLRQNGVERFDSLGELFDPARHEAMRQDVHLEVPANHICEVFQAGYMIGDRLLRAARVSVSRGS